MSHKFKIGQTVVFRFEMRTRSDAKGEYGVTGYRPDKDGEPWDVIRSALERHDRVVPESELSALHP